jgi:hypothetical protein
MTPKEFNALNTNDRAFAIEGYLDGFEAAIDSVSSMYIRIGDATLDAAFIRARDSIVDMLKHNAELMRESML